MADKCSIQEKFGGHALMVIRIVLGIVFFMHGGQKVMGWFGGHGLVATVQMMTGMGLPAFLVYIVAFTEFLGGIALIFGVLTRLAAFGILCVMMGAIVTVHLKNGFFMDKHGFEYPFALAAMALSLVLGGPGCCAFDNLFCRKKE